MQGLEFRLTALANCPLLRAGTQLFSIANLALRFQTTGGGLRIGKAVQLTQRTTADQY